MAVIHNQCLGNWELVSVGADDVTVVTVVTETP